MTNSSLALDLSGLLGRGSVSTSESDLSRFGGDALGAYRAFRSAHRLDERAAAVAWPQTVQQIARVLKYATAHSIPVVPYGGGTGVMGAASAIDAGIILNLQRMNAVVSVDPTSRMARFQSGTILEDAHQALKSQDFRLGHDPWSRPIATIGGAISTNGVGYTASGDGWMSDQVLGMTVVLANGEIIGTRSVPKSSYGPSLDHFFIGSEGTFGVIADATLRVFPRLETRELRSFDFPEFEYGFKCIDEIYHCGLTPLVMDYGDAPLSENPTRRDTASLFVAFEGSRDRVDLSMSEVAAICAAHDGRAGDPAEAERYWATRHDSALRFKKEVLGSPNPAAARRNRSAYRMDYLHVALPVSKVLDYKDACTDILERENIVVQEWSIWARPEFFSMLVSEPEGSKSPPDHLGETVDQVLGLAQDMGGTMESCHGVGIKLAHLTDTELGAGLNVIRAIKRSIDPAGILNPGKMLG